MHTNYDTYHVFHKLYFTILQLVKICTISSLPAIGIYGCNDFITI